MSLNREHSAEEPRPFGAPPAAGVRGPQGGRPPASDTEGAAVTDRPRTAPGAAETTGTGRPSASTDQPKAEPIRVLIADDHALFRRGLEMVLDEEDGIELVGQASDGAEAVEIASEAVPDVVLMDIRMPKTTGIEAARQMKEVAPSAKIVMLTSSAEEDDPSDAIRAGASGYLVDALRSDELAASGSDVPGGQSRVSP